MQKLCLKRDCDLADLGPHLNHVGITIHNVQGIMLNPESNPEINWKLEDLKKSRGFRCIQCTRALIPTDKDYAFCEDCWKGNMDRNIF